MASFTSCMIKHKLSGKVMTAELRDSAKEYEARGMAPDAAMVRAVEEKIELLQMEEKAIIQAVRSAYEGAGGKKKAPKAKQDQPEQPAAKSIADFGEKIGGARKDVWTSFRDDLNAVADDEIASQPLSKIWPAPDYQKLIDGGMDTEAVAIVRALRDEVPAKPRNAWKLKRWAEQVKMLREFANDVMDGKMTAAKLRTEMNKAGTILRGVNGRIDLYMEVGHAKSLEGIRFQEHYFSIYKGQENVNLWVVEKDAAATAFSNWPKEIATGKTKEDAIANFKAKYDTLNTDKAAKQPSFDIWSEHGTNGYFIGKKIGRNYAKLAGPFASVKEARQYRDEQTTDLQGKLEKFKEIPLERRDVNEPRVGEDMRNGQDVTPEMFADTFKFRGVEFGNWVEQGRRQKDLNDAFDALMDMAAILNAPPAALSLNGQLGLAFGARGSGGVNPAAAHYERDKIVINLTKRNGAGSLGHEWWHALDNYFSRMRSKGGDMMTDALDVSLASRDSDFMAQGKVRREMIQAFGEVVKAIKNTALKARSQKLDNKRTKEYWTTNPEMSARAFESYLISKLQDQNASNDYLANIVDPDTWKAAEALGFELDDSYPYPTAGEIPVIRAAFDHFFQTIEAKPGEDGNVALAKVSAPALADPFDQSLYDDIGQGKSATDILTRIANESDNALNREMAQALLDAGINPKVTQETAQGKRFTVGNAPQGYAFAAAYSPKTDTVMLFRPEEAARNALHEFVHAGTFKALRKGGQSAVAMKQLFAHVQKSGKAGGAYGMSNLDEFTAEALSNPEFQAMLREVTAMPEGSKFQNAWNWFVDIVRRALGLPTKYSNALDQALRYGRGLMLENSGDAKQDGVLGNTIDQTKTTAFRKWFGNSKAVDANGNPLVVYHGTLAGEFDQFKPGSTAWTDGIFFTSRESIARNVYAGGVAEFNVAGMRDRLANMSDQQIEDVLDRANSKIRGFEYYESFDDDQIDIRKDLPAYLEAKFDPIEGMDQMVDRVAELFGVQPRSAREGSRVIQSYLKIENPLEIDGRGDEFDAEQQSKWIKQARDEGRDGVIIRRYSDGGFGLMDTYRSAGVHDVYIAFNSNQVKSATGNNGNFDPDEPSILGNVNRDTSTVGGAFDMLKDAKTLSDTTKALKSLAESDRKFNLWDRTVGTQFNKATKDADFKRVFDAYNQQTNDVAHYAIEAERQAPDVLQRLESVKDIGKALMNSGKRYKADLEAVSKALFANIEGKEGVQQKVYSDAELKKDFKLNDKQILMYKQARHAVNVSLDRLAQTTIASMGQSADMDIDSLRNLDLASTAAAVKRHVGKDSAIAGKVDELVERVAELKLAGYMPAMRFGEYAVTVWDANKKGDPLHFEMFESQMAANIAANRMAKEFPGAKIDKSVMNKEMFSMFKGVSPETVELFAKYSGMDQSEAYKEYIALAKSSRSSMQRMINRKGIAGFSEDVPRVLASFLTSNARQASMNMNMGAINEALASESLAKKGDVQREAQKLHEYMANPLEEAQRLRGFMFMYFLGGSVASAAVNLTQPVLQTTPYLSQWAGGNVAGIMAKAAQMAATGKIDNAELKKAADRAAEEGLTVPQEIHALMADASGSTLGSSLRARALTKAWGGFFAISESFNRRLTFLAAYQTAQGMTPAELEKAGFDNAYDFAARAIIETQGLYSKTNRPNWARGPVGATLFVFKQFSVSYVEFLNRLPAKQKALALGILVMAAGLQGLPFAEDIEDLIDTLGQSLGYNTNSKKALREAVTNAFGEDLGSVLTYGLSAKSGIDLHGRLGTGNLLPGTGVFKMSQKDKGRDVAEFAGALGGVLNQFQTAMTKAQAGNFMGKTGALATMAPVAVKNALQGAEMAQTGEYRDTKGRKVQDVDLVDSLVKSLGFQPQEIAAESRRIQALQQDNGMMDAVKSAIAERWASGVADNDKEAIDKAREALKSWNDKNPDTPIRITPRSIQQRAREMKKTKAERYVKAQPKDRRQQVQEELG
jgi:hypothetical protein